LSVQTWLEIHQELAQWQEKSRAIMTQMFPNGQYESWTQCQRLLPHAKEVIKLIFDRHDEDRLNVATISSNCGRYLRLRGAYNKAETMHWRALEAQEKVLGPEHPNMLTSINNLGLVLNMQGKYKEAQTMHRRVLEAREKVLGPEHPNTLVSVNNLGLVLSR
jgi:tetratricopeptide (TPR) repeat protein